MNKKIVALAVAAAFAVPAAASANTTLFGQFKYEVGYVEGANLRNGE
jgi:predicted porin